MKSRTSLTLDDCGNFAGIKALAADVKTLPVATLYGIVSGTAQRKSPDKTQIYHGLMGVFRVKPNGDGETIESGNLYFPPAFNKLMEKAVAEMQKTPGTEITFCYDLSAVRANNDAGFTVNFAPRLDLAVVSRMDDFVAVADKVKKK